MEFQPFVPEVASTYLRTLLEGDHTLNPGLLAVLEGSKKLADVAKEYESAHKEPFISINDDPTGRMLQDNYNQVVSKVEIIKRLGTDERMKPVYSLLTQELNEPPEWKTFLRSAWHAASDYQRDRDEQKKAADFTKRIATGARELSEALVKFNALKLDNKPQEFFDLRHLLHKATSESIQEVSRARWKKLKNKIVGEHYPLEADLHEEDYDSDIYTLAYKYATHWQDVDEEVWHLAARYGEDSAVMHLAWTAAPDLSELLFYVEKAAQNYSPEKSGMAGAAIQSRKSNRKTEYIRAFAYSLAEDQIVHLSKNIMKAMAGVANVVLNDLEIDASYDDVRKAVNPAL